MEWHKENNCITIVRRRALCEEEVDTGQAGVPNLVLIGPVRFVLPHLQPRSDACRREKLSSMMLKASKTKEIGGKNGNSNLKCRQATCDSTKKKRRVCEKKSIQTAPSLFCARPKKEQAPQSRSKRAVGDKSFSFLTGYAGGEIVSKKMSQSFCYVRFDLDPKSLETFGGGGKKREQENGPLL